MAIVRRLVRPLLVVLALLVGVAAAAVATTQTVWFKNWLRGYIEREAALYLNGQLSIGRLGGNLFSGVELEDIRVSIDGRPAVSVTNLSLDYSVFEVISKGISLDRIRLNKPVLVVRREGDSWSIGRLIKRQAQEADRQGPASPMSIRQIDVTDGSIIIEDPAGSVPGVSLPKRFDKIDARMDFEYAPVRYSSTILQFSFRASDPDLALNSLSGGLAVRDDTFFLDKLELKTAETALSVDGAIQQYLTKPNLNLRLSSDKVSLEELSGVVPALAGMNLQPAFLLKLDGPLDRLSIELDTTSAAGTLKAGLLTDLMTPSYGAAGTIAVNRLDFAPLAPLLHMSPTRTDITGTAKVDLRAASVSDLDSIHGNLSIDAARIVALGYAAQHVTGTALLHGRKGRLDMGGLAYGARVSAAGLVALSAAGSQLSYSLKGRTEHLDLRRLPASLRVPAAETDLSAAYRLVGTEPVKPAGSRTIDGEFQFSQSVLAGARIVSGSTAVVSLRGPALSYQADATIADLNLQRVGQTFNLPALSTDRYDSRIAGHLTARGSGTSLHDLSLAASGTLTDSVVLGGRLPHLTFDASLAQDTAHVVASGTFQDFDPALLSGKPAFSGDVAGALDVDATIAGVSSGLTLDRVSGTTRLTLGPSTIGGLAATSATIDSDYLDRTAQIRTLEVVGPDLRVQASGTLALGEKGNSNLKLRAETTRLQALAALFEVPIAGIGRLDSTITGNLSELRATGTFAGNDFKYQSNGALTVSSDYTVVVPDLVFERARIDADTRATFATLAGQNINELSGKTTYADKRVVFDATARQPERSLGLAGALTFEADQQLIQLERLSIDTRGMVWQLAPAQAATIRYRGEAIGIENLRLMSGDQEIDAGGRLGDQGDALDITLTNVDLAAVDALLLRPAQFTGRVNASASVTGRLAAPAVDAAFRVTQGGFRQFKYDTLGGTVKFAGKGLTIDARLQQNPTQWMTAKGYVPTALFGGTGSAGATIADAATARGHVDAATAEDAIDLVVDSSPIDLGVVQGFTTQLTEVTGTLEAHVRVRGSVTDPHPEGVITIQSGAATVVAGGVRYTDIAGRIDLEPDRVHVDRITALDNHKSPVTMTGDLAVHEREIGSVEIHIKADDFKVIDNEIGNVRVDARLEITGELRAPHLQGDLSVTTGTINADELAAQTGPSAYSTSPIELESGPGSAPAETRPSLFDALKMDVHLTVPDDLLVKASDLHAGGAPIGLGALSVTLGGDVRVTKVPRGRVLLVGEVGTIRGTYNFQGRRFEILRDGAVRFDGTEEFDPRLDLRTRRIIRGVEARVNVGGTLREPEIVLTSTPPLEPSDILSLIVFNQPINELGQAQQVSLAARATGLLAGAVAGGIAQSIGSALGLETFELDLAPETGTGPQLTLGQQIGQSLYLKVQQELGGSSATNVVLEYAFTNWLRLQSNVLQSVPVQSSFQRAPSTGADLNFSFSH